MNGFDDIRRGFTKRIEDLIVDMEVVTRPDGIQVQGSQRSKMLAHNFGLWMDEIEKGYHSTEIVMIPAAGGSDNHE